MKRKYNDDIYAFDIETTTINEITSHYLSNISFINFQAKDQKNIKEYIHNYCYCRSAEDINTAFININRLSESENITTIIYIHNLSYEFDYLIKNIDFIRKNFDNENCLFLDNRKPLYFRCKSIEFRCSYLFLNTSLKILGQRLGFPKLEIDYNKQYFSFSKLPEEEYLYNKRDVDLTLLAVLSECNKWDYIKSVGDIPYTSTSLVRKNNDFINTKEQIKNYTSSCYYQVNYDDEYIAFLKSLFMGGYTHANIMSVAKKVKNVLSFDIVSSYPFVMLFCKFPKYFKEYTGKNKIGYLKRCVELNNKNYINVIKNFNNPFKYSFLTKIKIKNVSVKSLPNNNIIVPISFSKCADYKKVTLDNGRILTAKELVVYCTEVDFYIYSLFYDFEIVDCLKLYVTANHKKLNEYVLNSVKSSAVEKATLKPILEKIENNQKITKNDFYNEKIGDYIYSDEYITNILNSNNQLELMLVNYMTSKNKLNGQYGINVEDLKKEKILYNINDDEYTSISQELPKYFKRDYICGIYVTAYARLNLMLWAYYVIHNSNALLLYSDTDSWKCKTDNIERLLKCNESYNNLLDLSLNNKSFYNFGTFEYEKKYDYFCTLGCKKYIFAIGKKITVTIAGVNKLKTSKGFTELFEKFNYNFNMLCDIAFSPYTILGYSLTKKLVSIYKNDYFEISVKDENNKKGIISGYNMVLLSDSDYILMDGDKKDINYFIHQIEKYQNRIFTFSPTLIYRNKNGEVTYKYIKSWKEELKNF